MNNKKLKGVCKWFRVREGWGFIQGPDGESDIFMHYSHINMEGYKKIDAGQEVEYELIQTDKGPAAVNIDLIG